MSPSKKRFLFIALILLLGFLLWQVSLHWPTKAPLPTPEPTPAPPTSTPTPTPTPEPTLTPEPTPTPEATETAAAKPSATPRRQPPKKRSGFQMEQVSAGAIDEDVSEGPPPEAKPEPITATKAFDDLMSDAVLIAHGFAETNTDEVAGVWSGEVTIKGQRHPVILNRIWDHMTDDYLPTSCVAFRMDNATVVGAFLRDHNLKFYEKKVGPKSKLIAQLKNKYLLEIWAPVAGHNKVSGKLYTFSKKQLQPLGDVLLSRDLEATADTDCRNLD
jgi:hypothetical protein